MLKKIPYWITALLLIIVLFFSFKEEPYGYQEVTFAPLFQILGRLVQTADSGLSRLISRDDWEEAQFGQALKDEMATYYEDSPESIYLNYLIEDLTQNSRKDFTYQVFVDPHMSPNAYAMPGGVIVISLSLIEELDNEAQLAAILAHEIAHIELDHCLNAIKFELAKEKYNIDGPGAFSFLYNLIVGMSFSKTEEDEADDYAFNLIARETDYWHYGLSEGFQRFIEIYGNSEDSGILYEFFQSHPDMEYRRDRFHEKAERLVFEGKKYLGEKNLRERIPMTNWAFTEEWISFDRMR